MLKQERAARTRQSLLRAAADTFDRQGFERASLTAIAADAGVTRGALTFHFASKSELADAVQEWAHARTRSVVESAGCAAASPIQRLIDITHAVVSLLDYDTVARAGLRLGREWDSGRQTAPAQSWYSAWLNDVRTLLGKAEADGTLQSHVEPDAVLALIGYVVAGMELNALHQTGTSPPEPPHPLGLWRQSSRHWLTTIWRLVLPDIVPAQDAARFRAEGTTCAAGRCDPFVTLGRCGRTATTVGTE